MLVQVGAASVHPGDYFVMTGEPYVVRLAFGLRRPRHGIPGRDLAGVVAAVGKDVTALRPGEEVFGWSTAGTLAAYACVPVDNLVSVPANLSVVDAAAVPGCAWNGVGQRSIVQASRPTRRWLGVEPFMERTEVNWCVCSPLEMPTAQVKWLVRARVYAGSGSRDA